LEHGIGLCFFFFFFFKQFHIRFSLRVSHDRKAVDSDSHSFTSIRQKTAASTKLHTQAMATLPPPPSGINLDDDKRASIMVTSIVTWCMAVLVVGLRIVSRRLKNIDLWIDDWLIIAALVRIISI
jgi:hypothetical protein